MRLMVNILERGKKTMSPITGPRCSEGSRKLRFPDYVTTAQDGGKVVSLTYRPFFTPRKYSYYQWRTQEFCSGGSTNLVEDRGRRERVYWGGSPLVRGCNFGTRNFISYSKIFLIFGTLRLFMMTTSLFVTANVKQLLTGGSFRILLPVFPNILECWRPEFSSF